MKKLFLTLLLLCLAGNMWAQSAGKVTMTILDKASKQGIVGAVVEVAPSSKPDSKKYYTTGYGGELEINGLGTDQYTLTATFLGYEDLTTTFKTLKGSAVLGKLYMAESATKIETITKKVQSLRASQSGDTLSYNAGAFKVANDADVEGLLKKMPGVTISNGSVEVQGETVQKVFVDGKEFFGDDVSTAIKSLPAETVDKIEVYNKLSDQAEFSGMDDGEGFKAINIVTKTNMRKGQFGKLYAGYGYQPETDNVTTHNKYTVGGNVNIFNDKSRLSILGLFNNINQQNFSFEDIVGATGAGSGRGAGRAAGQYLVNQQDGVATTNSLGLNFTNTWGKRENVTFQGSYFFNNTRTKNESDKDTWYEYPAPVDTMSTNGYSVTPNNNHRLNAKLDWKISQNQSLMSRTSFSYQSNKPLSTTSGNKYGESGYLVQDDYSKRKLTGISFSEFLQYRLRLGKAGRTMTVDGRMDLNDRTNKRNTSSNEAAAVEYGEGLTYTTKAEAEAAAIAEKTLLYQYITAPTTTYTLRSSFSYNEPVAKNAQVSLQYRLSYNHQEKDQTAYSGYGSFDNLLPNAQMTNSYESAYTTHRVGPGFRYSKQKNTIVANVYYQYSTLEGNVVGNNSEKISHNYNNFTYFAMCNYNINKENSIRVFLRSSTDNPSVTQLQSIYDVSTPQYLSVGNSKLNPSYSHSLRFHYINSNLEKGRTFMWMFSATYQQDYISSSTFYNTTEGYDITLDGVQYKPQTITTYDNMDNYWTLRTHISYGLPLSFIKCNLNLMGGINYSATPSAVYYSFADMTSHNYSTNIAKNMAYELNVTLGSNISEKIDFTLQWNGAYNQAWNTLASTSGSTSKNNYFSHVATGNLKWEFWKGITFTASCAYSQYVGFTSDYNDDYLLCNLYLGKKLFKNQRGELQIGVNDVANQNTAFARTTGSGYTRNSYNSVIGRYYTVQFVYNLRHFGKKGSTNASDYDYKESKSGVGMSGNTGGMRFPGPPPSGGGPR